MKKRFMYPVLMLGMLSLFCAAPVLAVDDAKDVTIADDEEVAVLHTTRGDIVLRFFPDIAPKHVENFKKLTREKFYDGVKFHRIIKGFMVQSGCPNSKSGPASTWGTGDPGYKIKAEFNDKPHVKGSLSMARSSDPNSAGSQFFICHGRAEHLDRQYTNFGQLVKGMDVLDSIANAPVQTSMRGERSVPVKPDAIKTAEIKKWSEVKKAD
jgi:peptidyl-prolyl cis-trans isomerase B (cyclophilin B)